MVENIYKLDLKDKKILHELNSNARQSFSQIAKKVGLSTEVVNYRIKKLEDEKIITNYQLITNLSKLGILQFKLCLSFQHIKSRDLEQIIQALKQKSEIKWIVSCNGSWDLIIAAEAKSIFEIDQIKDKTLTLFEEFIDQKAVAILVEASTFNREYLLDKQSEKKERIIMKQSNIVKLESIELEILKELSENARKSAVDIATKLKTTARIVAYHIQELVKKEVILGFKIAINYKKLGIKFHKTFIYLDNPAQQRVTELISYFENHKNIIHHVKVLGNWDLEPEFETSSTQEFNDAIKTIKDNFSDIIKKIDVITIEQEYKFVYF